MQYRTYILIIGVLATGCGQQQDLLNERKLTNSYVEPVVEREDPVPQELAVDHLTVTNPSVIFYVPKAEDLYNRIPDPATRAGIVQAIGDYSYYAGIVSDSLESQQIPVIYTDKQKIFLGSDQEQFNFDRNESSSPMGMILFDGQENFQVLPGMQTHISLLSAIENFFYEYQPHSIPLGAYFTEASSEYLHVYSSHSDILNQVGRKIDPSYYPKFGKRLAERAGKYHMSVFAYFKFSLEDSLKAFICRVPSRYDESSIKLYIWDEIGESVVDEIQLAENVWNEQWILVKDSWITLNPERGLFTIVSRKKEARMNEGSRSEVDSLYQWQWTGSSFKQVPATGLSLNDFPLKDWQSYQEPKKPTELTLIDEDYVWLPLETGDLTWENIIMELPKPYTMSKEPIENQLAAHQIDTLVTIVRPNLRLKFYQTPETILLVTGEVTDGSIYLKRGIKVGISKQEFISTFEKLSSYNFIPDKVKLSSKTADRIISYSFQGDTLARIEFTNFIH